jgi:hypothetical protein
MNRFDHVKWCKERALQYVVNGDLNGAFSVMVSGLGDHEETKNHPAIQLGMMLLMGGKLGSKDEMTKFIEGFN